MANENGSLDPILTIRAEQSREDARKESLERRGITVITTSGVLITLIFAFASAVAKGEHFGNFNLGEKITLGIALAGFALSSLFALTTNTPRRYGAISIESMGEVASGGAQAVSLLLDVLATARYANDNKAFALLVAMTMQVAALLIVAVTVMIIII